MTPHTRQRPAPLGSPAPINLDPTPNGDHPDSTARVGQRQAIAVELVLASLVAARPEVLEPELAELRAALVGRSA